MKYIKYYENYTSHIELEDKYCWLIYGDRKTILKIYNKFSEYQKIDQIDGIKKDLQKYITKNSLGVYIFYNKYEKPTFCYWIFDSISNQNNAKDYIKKSNIILQGTLNIENNKLILDTTEINIEKYNL